MLKHYLKIAIRHLRQQKVITAINIAGLSIGMACCMLIILFVKDERSQNFAYRITIEWWMLLMAGIVSIFIALLTISFQSVKAALMNTVRSLKTE